MTHVPRTVEVPLAIGGTLRIPVTQCRACAAQIFFARTLAGKLMPLASRPADDGRFVVTKLDPPTVESFDAESPAHAGLPRFHAHFADCPAAERFRKRKPHRRTVAA